MKNHTIVRFLLALGMGVGMFGVASGVAWLNTGSAFYNSRILQSWTIVDIHEINGAITEYIEQMNRLPHSLDELQFPAYRNRPPEHKLKKHGKLVDGWGRPYVFRVNDMEYTLLSYGRDGIPGGTGLDADLSQKNPRPEGYDQYGPFVKKRPSFFQFFFELPTGGILLTCLLCGMFASIVSLVVIKPAQLDRRGWGVLLVKLCLTFGASVFVAMYMSILHIPSGH